MSVERDVTVPIASAEMNDQYGVDFDFLGARDGLTTAEARDIAAELIEAADEADAAAIAHAARPLEPAAVDLIDEASA